MSDNVETMFYVRETPWHGLGVNVDEALNSQDALIQADLDWNVLNKEVFVGNQKAENYVANVRDSDNKILGIVTDRYKIVQNKDAFAFTDSLLSNDVKYETAGSLQGGKKVWMLAKLPSIYVLDDEINPYLVFTNSHDGTGAIKVAITPVRVVCQNTLNIALNTAKRAWSTKHMGNMDFKMEEAKRTLELAKNYITEFSTNAVDLANDIVTDAEFADFLDELFPYPKKETTDRKMSNIALVRKNLNNVYRNTDDISEFVGTKWGVINAVSDMVTHSEPLRKTDSYKENLFGKIIDGHGVIDEAYAILQKL